MTSLTAAEVFRDYALPAVPGSGPNQPLKREIRALLGGYESLLGAAGGGLAYSSRALLFADLAHADHLIAIVYNDPTAAFNGTYIKIGASGTGSWTRIGDLQTGVIRLTVTGGTGNAIVATAPETPSVPGSKLYLLTPTAPNTTATTIAVNGGSAVAIKNAFGVDLASGSLLADSQVLMAYAVDHYQLLISANVDGSAILAAAVAAQTAAQGYATAAASSAAALGNQVRQYDTRAQAIAATIPVGVVAIKITRFAAGYPLDYATYIPGTVSGPMAFQEAGGHYWELDLSGGILLPSWFGAKGDGVTNDGVALQAWATALSDGGIGLAPSKLGYATAQTITFMPSTNVAPVQGPKIVGNLKLIGHASLALNADLLRIWNPTAVATTQNFYFPSFDGLEVSNTTGTGNGVSLRGYWGKIGKIIGTGVNDVVNFPWFAFGGVPDEYESMCDIGDVTGIDYRGYVINNMIGIGASITAHNVRGTIASLAAGLGCIFASGSENITGAIAYSGKGPAVTLAFPPAPALQTTGHEFYMQGNGDIDAAEYGFRIETAEFARITGHRLNIEPAGFVGIVPSWPLVAYSFGKAGALGRVVNSTVKPYITIRPGVTAGNIATFTGTGSGTNLTASSVTGTIHIGDYINGTGVPAGTYIVSQTSGTTGGAGVYVTSKATTSSAAALTDVGNIGTLFDFNNDPNIANLTVNVQIDDSAGILGSTLLFAGIYKNIQANATLRIIQNGVVVFNNMDVFTFAQLPPAALGLRGVRYTCRDSNTSTFNATIAGGGSNVVGALCNGTNWVVG